MSLLLALNYGDRSSELMAIMDDVADAIDKLDDAELPSQVSGEAGQEVAAGGTQSTAGSGGSTDTEDQGRVVSVSVVVT